LTGRVSSRALRAGRRLTDELGPLPRGIYIDLVENQTSTAPRRHHALEPACSFAINRPPAAAAAGERAGNPITVRVAAGE